MLILPKSWNSQPQEAVQLSSEYAGSAIHALIGSLATPSSVVDLARQGTQLSFLPGSSIVEASATGVDAGGRWFRTARTSSTAGFAGAVQLGTSVRENMASGEITVILTVSRVAGRENYLFGPTIAGGLAAGNAALLWWSDNNNYFDVGNETQRVVSSTTATGLQTLVFTWDNASKTKQLWMNGALRFSDTADPDTISSGTTNYFALANGLPCYGFWVFNRKLANAQDLSRNPWQVFEPSRTYIPLNVAAGGTYTLNLETGVYSFTGTSATLTKDSKLTLDSGTYTLSSSNASLLKGLILEASSGSYSLTGNDASLFYTHLLNASSGSYSVTGSDATLTYTPTSGAYTLNLESGAYVLLGQDVTFVYSGSEVTLKAGSWIRYRIIT